jgi:chromate reductase, NAD(P)H dehydrogenase (quinone)
LKSVNKLKILGFAGSLRVGSYNKVLLRATIDLLPEDVNLEIFEIDGIPLFNQDIEKDMPIKVKEFKSKIRDADAILIATPEYNYSVPGVLKNAIDWASRPYGDNAFDKKPVAIISAPVGMLGGARAQYHLRQTFVFLNMYPVNGPEVMLPFAQDKFDSNGKLTDENTNKYLRQLLENLADWTRELQNKYAYFCRLPTISTRNVCIRSIQISPRFREYLISGAPYISTKRHFSDNYGKLY